MATASGSVPSKRRPAFGEVFAAFLRLGVSAFGGPVAHIGYFNAEFVEHRGWLDRDTFAQIVALCQFLPGPASSQVCIVLGVLRAGALGGALAWMAFTLPSAILLTAFALGIADIPGVAHARCLHGLLVAAVAVVALAVATMYRSLCPDVPRKSLALLSAAVITLAPATGFAQLFVILAGALYGRFFIKAAATATRPLPTLGNRVTAVVAGAAFFALLFGLPVLDRFVIDGPLHVVTAFYESGALVFGGGHVVLPLLQARVVPPAWIGQEAFLAGYGAAQAVPGPLFTFAAYLGAVVEPSPHGVTGAALGLIGIFLPGILILIGALPHWETLRARAGAQAVMRGINAAVVGILGGALYSPLWTSSVRTAGDFSVALIGFILLVMWRAPPLLVVVIGAVAGVSLRQIHF